MASLRASWSPLAASVMIVPLKSTLSDRGALTLCAVPLPSPKP